MSSDEYESDLDEFLDGLPAHLRTKTLRKAYGESEGESIPLTKPFTARESALWWTLLPFACALSLALVGIAVLLSALLLWPLALFVLALASVPVGLMAVWRLG